MSDIRPFAMPKWGIEMTEGLLAEWKVGEGQAFARGDVIALIETDKITNDVEAEFDGVLRRALAETGGTYPVGALLGVFASAEASDAEVEAFVAAYRPAGDGEPTLTEAAPAHSEAPPPSPIPPDLAISPAARAFAEHNGVVVAGLNGSGRTGRLTLQDVVQASRPEPAPREATAVDIHPTGAALDGAYASPLAKRLAVKHGVELAGLVGAGPRGRIRKDDVLAVLESRTPSPPSPSAPAPQSEPPPAPTAMSADVEIIRMTPMRKAIARRLTLSKTTIPHFYLRAEPRADALQAMRGALNAEGQGKVTVNDLIVRACALALHRSPEMNIQVHGEEVHRFRQADIAVAVSTERGLLTPIVRAADTKEVRDLGAEIRALAKRARAGQLRPEEFEGGTFSVSNLGMYGVSGFEAVINPPQGAILAVGGVQRRMVERGDGGFGFGFAGVLPLSLSCDHRAIDGAVGARFLQLLCELLEAPSRLLGEA